MNYKKERKTMTAIETKIKKCIEPIINNLGYQLYDVIYEKEGKENYLRIFIDKAEGISLNDESFFLASSNDIWLLSSSTSSTTSFC